jgi:hypothetical protein
LAVDIVAVAVETTQTDFAVVVVEAETVAVVVDVAAVDFEQRSFVDAGKCQVGAAVAAD